VVIFDEQDWSLSHERQHQTATCCVIGDGIVVSDVEKARVTR
jgi:hypothetical protein